MWGPGFDAGASRRLGGRIELVPGGPVTPPRYRACQPSWGLVLLPIRTVTFVGGHRARIHPVGHPARRQRPPRHRRGPRRPRAARLPHRRPARRGVSRVARPGPGRGPEQRAALADARASRSTWRRPARRKTGAGLDLAIAVGVLVASEQIPPRPSPGTGSSASSASTARCAGCPAWRRWWPCSTTSWSSCRSRPSAEAHVAAAGAVSGRRRPGRGRGVPRPRRRRGPTTPARRSATKHRPPPDLADVRGQPVARRALEIAAAGGHHLLLVGPPGSGKTMLAQRLARRPAAARPGRRARGDDGPLGGRRAAAAGGLVDGAAVPGAAPHELGGRPRRRRLGALRPGEISLAHGGVLFLDELGEFPPSVLDALREPLEEGVIRVARAHSHAVHAGPLPARRGHQPVPVRRRAAGVVRVRRHARLRYLRRLSGPLLDRFDLRVAVQRPAVDELLDRRRRAERRRRGAGRAARGVAARPGRPAQRRAARRRCSTSSRRSTPTARAPAARRARARAADRPRLPPHPAGRPHDRRPRGARHGVADAAGGLDVEHVSMALSLRTRLRAATAGTGGVMSAGARGPATADGCLAALAGFDLMTSHRLRVLLAHHDPARRSPSPSARPRRTRASRGC